MVALERRISFVVAIVVVVVVVLPTRCGARVDAHDPADEDNGCKLRMLLLDRRIIIRCIIVVLSQSIDKCKDSFDLVSLQEVLHLEWMHSCHCRFSLEPKHDSDVVIFSMFPVHLLLDDSAGRPTRRLPEGH
jgi:hypothetical protein